MVASAKISKPLFSRLTFALAAMALGLSAVPALSAAGANPRPANPPKAPTAKCPEHKLSCPAQFITCMTWDKFRHAAWIGTEGHGVYEYRPWAGAGNRWVHFSKSNGLADNSCYAIAVDSRARVWAGTDRHGVDVFVSQAKGWQRYDVLPLAHPGKFGPLGSHPFAIAMDPYKPLVWLVTEAGISIYNIRRHTWQYLTVSNGLPTNQISTIDFLSGGKVILGTQCDGLAIGTSRRSGGNRNGSGTPPGVLSVLPQFNDLYRWRVITGPFHTPARAFGSGLPCSLINAVYTPALGKQARISKRNLARLARHQEVYAGTDSGLAFSTNSGQSWKFEQGRDYAARVMGLFHPPEGFRPPPKRTLKNLLPGEHITCIARDALGNLWLGFWRDGYMVISPHGRHVYRTEGDPRFTNKSSHGNSNTFVQAILPLPNGKVLLGRYGGHGVSLINPAKLAKWLKPGKKITFYKISRPHRQLMPVLVKFPAPAAVPTVQQIIALRNALLHIKPNKSTAAVIIPLNDDWRTRGNWIDRYGNMYAHLFSIVGNSLVGGYSAFKFFPALTWINRKWRLGDAARHWRVGRIHNSTDPRTLQDPQYGGRTEANSDDHGETYPETIDGPNLYWTCMVPAGSYIMSAYFFNDDGHSGPNRDRDYVIQVSDTPMPSKAAVVRLGEPGVNPVAGFDAARPTAIGRCEYFWGGVYKRFFIRVSPCITGKGGTRYGVVTICVRRNYSLNAIIEGTFFDCLGRRPRPVPRHDYTVALVFQPAILPYHPGQSSFPDAFGHSMRGFKPLLGSKVDEMPAYGVTACDCMQELLYLRTANAPWFAQYSPPIIIELTRYFAGTAYKGLPLGAYLARREWYMINSCRFLGSLLRTVPQQVLVGEIYFGTLNYLSYAWWYMGKHYVSTGPNENVSGGPREEGKKFYKAFLAWTLDNMRKEIQWKSVK